MSTPTLEEHIAAITGETFSIPGRIEFPSGHAIDIHENWRGQVLYQVWPPGIENQSQFDRLIRMDVEDFLEALREHLNDDPVRTE
jgi:hypothetical protein